MGSKVSSYSSPTASRSSTPEKSTLRERRSLKGFTPPTRLVVKPRSSSYLSEISGLRQPGAIPEDESKSSRRRIQWTDHISELYGFGADVMASTNPGMRVRFAMRLSDGQQVVIKVRCKKTSFPTKTDQEDWCYSTELMLNLPSSNCIAQVYEVWEDFENYYIVMERVDGEDLCETLDSMGRFSIAECKEVLRQTLLAVDALHSRGCIHKDIKLENIMLESPQRTPTVSHANTPKLDDRPVRVASSNSIASTSSLEKPVVKLIDFDDVEDLEHAGKSGTVMGTKQYISQEAYGGIYSPASDMFAVGVIAYKLLTGVFPFSPSLFDDRFGENVVGSPKMRQIQQCVRTAKINWWLAPFPTDTDACEFCKALLSAEASSRLTAREALEHVWMKEEPSPDSTPVIPRRPSFVTLAGLRSGA
mmetsp:Transcript_84415/g.149326  ORF Transcript_84415/g.149326 Transcript_84415/m.149326 type:complete len:418 (+) Transcript_84415:105-1358(+)|eukprot:CAMPEP_0197678410 /NCGR_PEP_ID=MMETSP1338-20131121/89963_1 /TAXON_ID=43686 ORGANISM="Pelagodinium beii, Strain RCC1491" /NCGR_SAMPLE_ID=MMETSP1338 /ASSEMBLY_ACC=CAM_ASM_000754 /LENGTH=417 /DNA_ID=CAMNT_0043259349 /DNA_START=5 /DNA_END=1258 /DNA_ORIENTATION=-